MDKYHLTNWGSVYTLYEKVIEMIAEQGIAVEKGVFGEYMHVSSTNDGPVTFLLDSE